MKRHQALFMGLGVTVFVTAMLPVTALAHVLKADNGISAVLHIPPDDNAVAGRTTRLDFEFSSEHGHFSLAQYDCSVSIQNNGKVIQSAPLTSSVSDDTVGEAIVTFPQIGVYDVIVTGKATDDSFSLDYVERVATSVNNSTVSTNHTSSTILLIGIASFTLLIMCAYAFIQQGGRYRRVSK